ncbi:MAG: hypothetical protein AAGB30_10760 [Pedobacter sp.]
MENHKDYLLELLRDRYDQESTRYKEFENALGLPVTILTALLAGLYIVGTDIDVWKCDGLTFVLLYALSVLLGLFIIVTICLLACVYWGINRAWHTLPESKTIKEVDVPELSRYVNEVAPDNFEVRMVEELKTNAIDWYTECNTTNTSINNYRGIKMFYARLFLLASLFCGLLLLGNVIYIKQDQMSKQIEKPKEAPKRPAASPITHQRNDKSADPKTVIKKK